MGHGTLGAALVVKLTRVILLAPLVAGVALSRRRSVAGSPGGRAAGDREPADPPALVPLFVVGFVLAVLVRSSGLIPSTGLVWCAHIQQTLLTAALFGLGTGISWRLLRRAGGRPLLLGLLSWLLVAAVAYGGVRLTGA